MMTSPSTQNINWAYVSWDEACSVVAQFTDNLGMPVDDGIFETVVVLNLLGIRTVQSCEGHLDHGCSYPWVIVTDPECARLFNKQWLHVCELEEQIKGNATEEAYDQYLSADLSLRISYDRQWEKEYHFHQRLTHLIDNFYESQNISVSPTHLIVERFKPGTYRIAPGFSLHVDNLPNTLKGKYLAHGQAEIQAFTQFLKHQWESSLTKEAPSLRGNVTLYAS